MTLDEFKHCKQYDVLKMNGQVLTLKRGQYLGICVKPGVVECVVDGVVTHLIVDQQKAVVKVLKTEENWYYRYMKQTDLSDLWISHWQKMVLDRPAITGTHLDLRQPAWWKDAKYHFSKLNTQNQKFIRNVLGW